MNTNLTLRIASCELLQEDVAYFELTAQDGAELPAYEAGAHLDVEVSPGVVRQYSLLGDPAERKSYKIAVKLETASRGGSKKLHQNAREWIDGDHTLSLNVGRPRQAFPLVKKAKKHILIGLGIGITPIVSMAYQLVSEAVEFSAQYYSAAGCCAFRSMFESSEALSKIEIMEGLSTQAIQTAMEAHVMGLDPEEHLYVCGPPLLISAMESLAQSLGKSDRLHSEKFAPVERIFDSGQKNEQVIRLKLARSGTEIMVAPTQTLSDAIVAAGGQCEVSCRQGICGTCITSVLDGIPDHRDSILSSEEKEMNQLICPCVSRASTPHLVLDI